MTETHTAPDAAVLNCILAALPTVYLERKNSGLKPIVLPQENMPLSPLYKKYARL